MKYRLFNMIATIIFAAMVCVAAPSYSQTQSADIISSQILLQSGSLLALDIDLRTPLIGHMPMINAALDLAGQEGHAGIVLNLRAVDLLNSDFVEATDSIDRVSAKNQLNSQLKEFSEIKQAAHAKNLLAVISVDGRLRPGDTLATSPSQFAFAREAAGIKMRGPVTALRWADGSTSPVLAVNDINASNGLFLFNHEFGLKYQRLFSSAYLTDRNTASLASRWVSNTADSAPIATLQFTQPFNVDGVKLFFQPCYPCASFEVWLRTTEHRELRGDWVKVYSINNNESSEPDIQLEKPSFATELQIKFFPKAGEPIRLHEVEVWITNDRGQKLNMAPLAAVPSTSSIMNSPDQQMIVINNDKVFSLADSKFMQEHGVLLMPGRYALLCLGDTFSGVKHMLGPDMSVSWFSEVRELNTADAMRWMNIPLPLHHPSVRRSVASVVAQLSEAFQPDAILVSNFTQSGLSFDVGESAQLAFESAMGRKIDNMAADIITFEKSGTFDSRWIEKPGPLYSEWIAWQSGLTAQMIGDASNQISSLENPVPLGVLIHKPLVGTHRQGLNWAKPSYQLTPRPTWITPQYIESGVGDFLQVIAIQGTGMDQLFSAVDCSDGGSAASPQLRLDTNAISQILPDKPLLTLIPLSF